MSEATMNLINAIEAGDAVGIETSFGAAMAEKISTGLESMRADVAQNMFKTVTGTEQAPQETTTSEE